MRSKFFIAALGLAGFAQGLMLVTGFDEDVDLDQDGVIGLSDYLVLVSNMDRVGDEP